MEVRKERNFINAYDGETKLGGWNISTGEFIGKSGKPVKGTPACFTYTHLEWFGADILTGAIRMYREYWGSNNNHWAGNYTPARANRLEQMISVGIYPCSVEDLDSTIPLTKDIVNWIQNRCHGSYQSRTVEQYTAMQKYAKQLPENPPEWVEEVIPVMVRNDIPSSFFIPAIRRLMNEGIDYLFQSNYYRIYNVVTDVLRDYYKYSMSMWGNVKVEPNILTNVCKIRKLYQEYQNAHYDELLKEHNDKEWLYFENHLLTARPLLTKADFHDEAEKQHNCVERLYMEKVRDGETHIVSIRYKDLPDQPYVTCEVNNQGKIVQYLTVLNHRVTDRGGMEFEKLYQNHLLSSFKE